MNDTIIAAYLLVAGWMDMGPHDDVDCPHLGCTRPGRWVFDDVLDARLCTVHAGDALATNGARR